MEALDTLRDLIDHPKPIAFTFSELDPRQQPLFFGQTSRQSIQPFMIVAGEGKVMVRTSLYIDSAALK